MGERPVFEGRIDLVRGQFVLEHNDDPSVLAEVTGDQRVAGQAQPRPAQDRVPEPQPAFPAVAGQQRAGGVEGRTQAAIVMAFEGRPPDAGGGVPEVDLGVDARRCRQRGAVGAPGDVIRGSPQGDRPDKPAGLSPRESGRWAGSTRCR